MSSLIEGYNYDVFISYRQKDNKGDKWVSKFVESLKTELEATFKEEVSVYFDENLQDRLQETHHVNKSLEGKLKCVIFIPILSQTYCDPNSYAWKNEFLSFLRMIDSDSLGRDVRLRSGNVASRILPVRIHDLEQEDIKLFEEETGSALRAMDFVFETASGVSRPLNAHEEHPHDNLNETYYNDQINKVARAIKEIMTALKGYDQVSEQPPHEVVKSSLESKKVNKAKIIVGSLLAMVLIVLGILFIPKIINPQELEKSIAVLPFRNESTDQENSAFINGLMEKTLNNLQLIKDFRVISRTSVEQYRDQNKTAPEIAKELGVNYIVEGSGQKYGNTFSLNVQLIKADKREDHLWGRSFEQEIREVDDILSIQSEIAEAIAKELEANLTAEEKKLIDKIPTQSLTALDFYQTGLDEHWKYWNDLYNLSALDNAESLYKKALQYDSAFAQAYLGLADVYRDKHTAEEFLTENFLDSVLYLANKALSYDDDLAEGYVLRGDYFRVNGYSERALAEYDKAIDINPSSWEAYYRRAGLSDDIARAFEDLHKAESLNRGRELPIILGSIASVYRHNGFLEIGNKYNLEKLALDNDSIAYFRAFGVYEAWMGNPEDAVKYIEKAYMLDSTNLTVFYQLGLWYSFNGQNEEALEFFKRWLDQLDQVLVRSNQYTGMHRIGYAYWMNNRFDEANYYFDLQVKNTNTQININRNVWEAYYNRAGVYAFRGEKEKAYEDLRLINQHSSHNWLVLGGLKKADPLFNSIRNEPEFQQIVKNLESRSDAQHEMVRKWLEENNML